MFIAFSAITIVIFKVGLHSTDHRILDISRVELASNKEATNQQSAATRIQQWKDHVDTSADSVQATFEFYSGFSVFFQSS